MKLFYKRVSNMYNGIFVAVAVCTGTTAVVSVEFSLLLAPVSSTLDWLSAQISWGRQ